MSASPHHTPGIGKSIQDLPVDQRVCRAEFHLECMATDGKRWREFYGLPLEEFVDFVAEKVGTEVWYTTLPKAGRHSPLLSAFYDKDDIRESDVPLDFIPRFVERAHHHGILVVDCFKMNLWPGLGKLRPEWLLVDMPDGRDIQPNRSYLCHNTKFGRWLIDYLRDRVDRFKLDGVWFDDTQYGSRGAWPWPAGCLCADCRDLYQRETGREIPSAIDWQSDEFKHWVNWRYDNLREYQGRLTDEVRFVRPGAIVAYNSYPRASIHWTSANDLNPADAGTQFFIETDYRRMGPALTAKIARARGGVQCEIWGMMPQLGGSGGELHSIGYTPYQDPDFCSRFSLTAFANGVHVQGQTDYIHPDNVPARPYRELKKRREYLGGQSIRQCAVHLSRQTRDFNYITQAEALTGSQEMLGQSIEDMKGTDDFWKQLSGITEMPEQTHLVFDLMFDRSINPLDLNGYGILVLPNSACLSSTQSAAIRDWVRAGGTLVATYESSLYDELGHRLDNFGLAEAFGVDYLGTFDREADSGTIYVPQDNLCEPFGLWLGFAGQHTEIRARPEANLEVLCTLSTRRRFGPINPYEITHDSIHPGVTLNTFGRGKAIYISGDIGTGFCDHPLPQVRQFFSSLVNRGGLRVEVDAPANVFATAFEAGPNRRHVHLYHRFCPMIPWNQSHPEAYQWAALDKPYPVQGIRVRIADRNVRSARMPLQDRDLAVESGSNVVVPEVALHEVIVFELD